MAKSDLRIDILGTTINISADEDPAYLNKLLEKYRRTIDNVQRLTGIKDPLKTAVLTGFLLSDELEKAGQGLTQNSSGSNDESAEAEKLAMGIISRLDEMVSETETIYETQIPASVFKLKNTVKHYEWGSPEWIPALLGQDNISRIPWAELWMGVNAAGPSRAAAALSAGIKKEDSPPLLSELIARDSEAMIGKTCAEKYGSLPYLFKIIAVAKPLSIQAHPSSDKAKEGFDRENAEGLPMDAPNRNYRDGRHKPELICALKPFAALCGFREKEEILSLLGIICQISGEALKTDLEKLMAALEQETENPYKAFLSEFFSIKSRELGSFMIKKQPLLERDFPEYRGEWKLCSYLASIHPADNAAIAPIFLNTLELKPGEAMYIPPGVMHAYLYGLGIELMADTDNVLRGGLTAKHVDREELLRILDFSGHKPEILQASGLSRFSYPARYEEFTLTVLKGRGDSVTYSETGPSIVFITEGSANVAVCGEKTLEIKTGESAFIPAGKETVFSGNYSAYIAVTGITA